MFTASDKPDQQEQTAHTVPPNVGTLAPMIERVARAMHDYNCLAIAALPSWEAMEQDWRDQYLGRSRAAIEAMREPTEAMAEAADDEAFSPDFRDEWRAAIDAALKPEVQP